jgi:hypothetical protein
LARTQPFCTNVSLPSGRTSLIVACRSTLGFEALTHSFTPPAPKTVVFADNGAVTAWVRSSTPNVDLQATISEVRPDGQETFVQNGWLRGNERALDGQKSTPLEPVLSLREADVSPLPADRFVKATIPLYYEGHAYRAGSRIRVTIAAPNGAQPIWAFAEAEPRSGAEVTIAYGEGMPSNLLLPVVPDVAVPTALPPCPGLRGQPCRPFQPLANRAGEVTVSQVVPPATCPGTATPAPCPPAAAAPHRPKPGAKKACARARAKLHKAQARLRRVQRAQRGEGAAWKKQSRAAKKLMAAKKKLRKSRRGAKHAC